MTTASTRVVTNVMDGDNSDTGIGYGGGNGPARACQNSVWDEWDE